MEEYRYINSDFRVKKPELYVENGITKYFQICEELIHGRWKGL